MKQSPPQCVQVTVKQPLPQFVQVTPVTSVTAAIPAPVQGWVTTYSIHAPQPPPTPMMCEHFVQGMQATSVTAAIPATEHFVQGTHLGDCGNPGDRGATDSVQASLQYRSFRNHHRSCHVWPHCRSGNL